MNSEFIFTQEMMEIALEANGWRKLWSETNWVSPDCPNPDWGGVSLESAFNTLLVNANLISKKCLP